MDSLNQASDNRSASAEKYLQYLSEPHISEVIECKT